VGLKTLTSRCFAPPSCKSDKAPDKRAAEGLGQHARTEIAVASNDVQETAALSRNQQKKLDKREAKMQLKGAKKQQKQAAALADTLDSLEESLATLPQFGEACDSIALADIVALVVNAGGPELGVGEKPGRREKLAKRLLRTFNVQCGYQSLPLAFGPSPTQGLAVLGSAIVRPPKYTAKFLPQEYSLLHKLWSLLDGNCRGAGVIDIGAGNANCAVLAALLLGLTVVCVERESPRIELRAEAQLPVHLQGRIIRLESDVEDFDDAALAKAATDHGFDRVVMMAKHPCGIGVDRSIQCADKLKAGRIPVLGMVMATCCTNKLSFDDFKVSRVPEFCALYSPKARAKQIIRDCHGQAFEKTVELMSRCSAWRNTAGSFGSAILDEQLRWAELFEDSLQRLRTQRLVEVFGAATQVRFAPSECTMQDRCLVASAPPLPPGIWAHGDCSEDSEFLAQLRSGAEVLLADSGPIDCRPKGIRSTKYDFDYTDGAVDVEPPGD
jgi:hypothetical protein